MTTGLSQDSGAVALEDGDASSESTELEWDHSADMDIPSTSGNKRKDRSAYEMNFWNTLSENSSQRRNKSMFMNSSRQALCLLEYQSSLS